MKTLLKSQINIVDLILYPFYYSVFAIFTPWDISNTSHQMLIYLMPIFCYIIWCVYVNIYCFYEDKIEIVYIFRLFKRVKEVRYSDISEVRYIHVGGWTLQPSVVFVYKGKSFKKVFLPSNSFTHERFKNRKEILLFLHSKGLPIIINSVFNKDKEIIELTKANGSWNYQNVIDGKIMKY